jgi:hypothetical protein
MYCQIQVTKREEACACRTVHAVCVGVHNSVMLITVLMLFSSTKQPLRITERFHIVRRVASIGVNPIIVIYLYMYFPTCFE